MRIQAASRSPCRVGIYYCNAWVLLRNPPTPCGEECAIGGVSVDRSSGFGRRCVSFRRRLTTSCATRRRSAAPAVFREMLSQLPINFRAFTFIDIGSGKGRTLLMASDFPFRRIIGVELLAELHQIARENIRRYKNEHQQSFAIESQCVDAREFEFPNDPLVLYFFNPLPQSGMKTVLSHLEQSLKACPRDAYIVYHNPEHRSLLESSFLREFASAHQYVIYRTVRIDG